MSNSDDPRQSPDSPPLAVTQEDGAAHDAWVRGKVERALEKARSDSRRYSLDEVIRRFGVEG